MKNLSVGHKANRLEICQDLLGWLEIEPDFFDKVITGDELQVFDYNPETKQESAEWHMKSSPRPKKACMSRSRVKTVTCFLTTVALCTKISWMTSKTGPASRNEHCRWLGAAPQKGARSHCAFNSRISGEEKHSCTSTSSLQCRSGCVPTSFSSLSWMVIISGQWKTYKKL